MYNQLFNDLQTAILKIKCQENVLIFSAVLKDIKRIILQ